MAVFESALPTAVAQQLLVDLDAYEDTFEQVAMRRWDPHLSEQLSRQADRVQEGVGSLPRLALPQADFLITRAELVHALWLQRSPSRLYGRASILQAQHRLAIERLRRACQRIASVQQPAGDGVPGASAGLRL